MKTPALSNIPLERVLLSTFMLKPQTIGDGIQDLEPADFYEDSNKIVYSAIIDTEARGLVPDMPAVYQALKERNTPKHVFNSFYDLAKSPSTANHKEIIRIIRDLSEKRKIQTNLEHIGKLINDPTVTAADISAMITAKTKVKSPMIETITGAALMKKEIPELKWFIDRVIPKGCSLLIGQPKCGKSWMALDFILTFSGGGFILGHAHIQPGKALYVALEDTERRLKYRMHKQHGTVDNDNCHFATSWPTGEAGIAHLHAWIKQHPDVKLIVIDTLGKFMQIKDSNDYGQTLAAVSLIKEIADIYDLTIIVIHHTRKGDATDFMQRSLGSTAITGTADTTMEILRKRGTPDAKFSITGRDVQDKELAIRFDEDTCRWAIIGNAAEVADTAQRQQIIDLLKNSEPLTPKEISAMLGKNSSTTRGLLLKMLMAGNLEKLELSGRYTIKRSNSTNTINGTNTTNTANNTNGELDFEG